MYQVLKPIVFAGKRYSIGEIIEATLVNSRRAGNLIRSGYITAFNGIENANKLTEIEPVSISIPITKNGERMEFSISPDAIMTVFRVLQTTPEEAVGMVEAIVEEDELILINAVDQRKKVKLATEERALALKENRSDA